MRKGLIIAIFILIISGAVFLPAIEIVEEIVAIVNDDIITLSQYKEHHDAVYQMLKDQLQGEELENQYELLKKEMLESMITDILLLQAAKEKELNVSEQLKLTMDKIKEDNNFETNEDLRRELRRQGIDFEQWTKQMEDGYMKQGVIVSEVDRTIVIDESEVVNYYKLHHDEFTEQPEYKISGLYIALEGKTEEEIEAKKKEINGKIAAGETIASLATQYSEGPEKESQGALGTFKKSDLDKSLEQAVDKIKVGELTPWIQSRAGWYLLKLEEKKESRLKSFEESRKDIEEKMFTEKKQVKLENFLKQLKEKSYIKILNANPLNL